MKHVRNRNPAAADRAVHVVVVAAAAVTEAAVAAIAAETALVPAAATVVAAARKDSRTRIIAKSRVSRASLAGNNRICAFRRM
jgi:hypothetical protein